MQVVKIKNIPNIFQCAYDGYSIFILSNHQSFVRLYQFDSETFEQINSLDLFYKPILNSQIAVDNDCLYLPAIDGRILSIDKFSGDLTTNIDLGMALPSGYLNIQEKSICCSVGVPVNNTLVREGIDTYCFIKCNKQNGKKEIQSQRYKNISNVLELNNLYFYEHLSLCKINKNLEFETKTKLHFPSRQLMNWGDKIISISEVGTIEIFDIELNFIKNLMLGKIISDVCVNNDYMLVPCGNTLITISKNFDILDMHSFSVTPKHFCHSFWICKDGEVMSFKNNAIAIEKIYETDFKCIKTGDTFTGWNNKEIIQCSL